MSGFGQYDIATLETIRDNLLRGIEQVGKAIDNGTFHRVGSKGEAPPSQSGQLTLILLTAIEEELESRGNLCD